MGGIGAIGQSMIKTNGSSKSSDSWSMGQDIWEGQKQPLKDLYASAKELYGEFDPATFNSAIDYSRSFNQGLSDKAMPAWQNQLAGGYNSAAAAAAEQPLIDSLRSSLSSPSNTGQMYQSIVGGAGNSYIDPMVAAMRRGTIDSLNQQLPQESANAISAGQMGSSRHGIAEGLARSEANKYMVDTESAMRANAYDTDLNWKMKIAQLADQNIGATQDRAIGLLNSRDAAAQGALQQGQQMTDFGSGKYNAEMMKASVPWDMMMNYASVLGDPTVLTSGSGWSKSKGSSKSGK